MVRLAGLEPARLSPLPPQSSVSANSTISATVANQAVADQKGKPIDPVPTALPTVSQNPRHSKRFQAYLCMFLCRGENNPCIGQGKKRRKNPVDFCRDDA